MHIPIQALELLHQGGCILAGFKAEAVGQPFKVGTHLNIGTLQAKFIDISARTRNDRDQVFFLQLLEYLPNRGARTTKFLRQGRFRKFLGRAIKFFEYSLF